MNAWTTGAVSDYVLSLDLIGLCDEGDAPGCIDPGRAELRRLRHGR